MLRTQARFLAFAVLVLLFASRSISSQEIVYDNFIDLCYGPRPNRATTRCEGVDDIKVEQRLYSGTVPYWCIALDNRQGKYRTLTIEFNGNKSARTQDNYYAREIQTIRPTQDRFILQNERIELVIYPKDRRFNLQNIASLKLDNTESCDITRRADNTIFPNQPNTNRFKYLNNCFKNNGKDYRVQDPCEKLQEVIVQKYEFNNGPHFYCIIVDKSLRKRRVSTEEEVLEIEFVNDNNEVTWSSKSNQQISKTGNQIKWHLLRNKMTIAVFPKNNNFGLGEINSIKVNGEESCAFTETRVRTQECGQRKKTHLTLSSFGLPTYPGQFPWHVGIHLVDSGSWKYHCGGSILNQRTILTAAHCIFLGSAEGSAAAFRVHVGQHDLNEIDPEYTRIFRVLEIITHESYSSQNSLNDIALMKLRTVIAYNDLVQPICLPGRTAEFSSRQGFVAGWGVNEKNEFQYILNTITMPIVTDEVCERSNSAFFANLLRGKTFCAGYRNGSAVTVGDSGSGLVFDVEGGWTIKGIVSLGPAKPVGASFVVDISEFSLFTDVQTYIDWIEKYLN